MNGSVDLALVIIMGMRCCIVALEACRVRICHSQFTWECVLPLLVYLCHNLGHNLCHADQKDRVDILWVGQRSKRVSAPQTTFLFSEPFPLPFLVFLRTYICSGREGGWGPETRSKRVISHVWLLFNRCHTLLCINTCMVCHLLH